VEVKELIKIIHYIPAEIHFLHLINSIITTRYKRITTTNVNIRSCTVPSARSTGPSPKKVMARSSITNIKLIIHFIAEASICENNPPE
jgi:hypothetical protein